MVRTTIHLRRFGLVRSGSNVWYGTSLLEAGIPAFWVVVHADAAMAGRACDLARNTERWRKTEHADGTDLGELFWLTNTPLQPGAEFTGQTVTHSSHAHDLVLLLESETSTTCESRQSDGCSSTHRSSASRWR